MQRNSAFKIFALCLAVPLAIGICVGWLMGRRNVQRDEALDTTPVVLRIQKLGDLHTVAMHESEVLHYGTERDPDGWLGQIPGVESVVHWATHNTALVTAEGDVEAGLDLSQLHAADITSTRSGDGTTVLHVHLPQVTVYPPAVNVHVEDAHDGLFWRDQNIVPKAQKHAGERFVESAERAGIIAKARANAIDQVRSTLQLAGLRNVEPYF